MTDFLSVQLPFIAFLQSVLASSPALVQCWKLITALGNEEFFLLLLPILFWCVSERRGVQLGVLVIGGDALNLLVKLLFLSPRPYWFGAPIQALGADSSYGMPSGHAQNAVAIWLFLALVAGRRFGRNRCLAGAGLLILLISLSRVVLGMHFPSDVFGGWVIGAVWLWLNLKYGDRVEKILKRRKHFDQVTTAVALAAVYICIGLVMNNVRLDSGSFPGLDPLIFTNTGAYADTLQAIFTRGGTLLGLLVGLAYHYRRTRWKVSGSTAHKVVRFLIGLVGIVLIWRGLAMVLPTGSGMIALGCRFARYALLTGWVVWLAPSLFLRLRITGGGPRLPMGLETGHAVLVAAD